MHVGNSFVFDRVQTAGVTNLNIPQERIWELGDFNSVTTIRDIPDLTFSVESYDVSTALEAISIGQDPSTITAGPSGTQIDFTTSMPVDIISPFRSNYGAFDIVKGVIAPYLLLDTVSYKFGVKANSTKTFTYKGDSLYYVPGQPYQQTFNITSGTFQTYNLAHTAILYTEKNVANYVLCATATNPSTFAYKRLFNVFDFDNTTTTITTLADLSAQGFTKLNVVYGSTTLGSYAANVNASTTVKPGAIRGKDITIYVSDGSGTPTLVKWTGIQTVQLDRKVNLQATQELGNDRNVTQDWDQADVTGSIVFRPSDPADLQSRIQQITSVPTAQIAGPFSSVPLAMEVHINNPDTGARIQTLYIPDARFELPPFSNKINARSDITFKFTSEAGLVYAYNGAR